ETDTIGDDPDDAVIMPVKSQVTAKNVAIGCKMRFPKGLPQEDNTVSASPVFIFGKWSSKQQGCPQNREEIFGHHQDVHLLGPAFVPSSQRETVGPPCRDSLKGPALLLPVQQS